MRILYLVFIFHVHAQLQCDKTTIHSTIGNEINIFCSYNSRQFIFSKKYWCLGESRNTCEVLMDTDGFTTTRLKNKARIQDTRFRTFHILMTALQLEESGIYWAGIDKMYADIMFRIKVVVSEEAVSRPQVWLDGSPTVTCQGQPVLLHCQTERGTNVKYGWYREAWPQDILLQSSSDLLFYCAILTEDTHYICLAQNAVSKEQSKPISLHLVQAGQENCIYFLMSDEIESYDCRTMTESPVTTTSPNVDVSRFSEFVTQNSSGGNMSLCSNQTQTLNEDVSLRSWSEMPLWYDIIRWLFFTALITIFGILCTCMKTSRVDCNHHN